MINRYAYGVDPGTQGSLAMISEDHETVHLYSFSKFSRPEMAQLIEQSGIGVVASCLIEEVHSMPRDGVKGAFTFGNAAGFIHGVLLANHIPVDFIRPQAWQIKLGLGKKYPTPADRKRAHKTKAQELFPNVPITLENCDGLLIAEIHWRQKFRQ